MSELDEFLGKVASDVAAEPAVSDELVKEQTAEEFFEALDESEDKVRAAIGLTYKGCAVDDVGTLIVLVDVDSITFSGVTRFDEYQAEQRRAEVGLSNVRLQPPEMPERILSLPVPIMLPGPEEKDPFAILGVLIDKLADSIEQRLENARAYHARRAIAVKASVRTPAPRQAGSGLDFGKESGGSKSVSVSDVM